ncbi:putative cytosol aminopeptidase (Leucine aminopeptidase) (LAP) (Leucyl aminopeptidase) PepA [Bradyrhizobium sp. ORS 285]|uniref:leucyl aminopeptidase n=1 Tax=Bradyrhizobium sp. ORS 285 TaxID=115808 RepID=UPI0002408FB5|nr:leucyl aminopeptidase [Bradyrhizobium sp. ORS 285]CCD88094.1 putative cytosol aminopeptidase (Leucine aminopeptidase) (LAP) (Leucyl aminopeptidase) PepA [Bradyrhizobium sp. ORS 285]SMX58920.1 putative cytosol aminopeptidase (Leucine aminopeptidase) (LAP) (Leucyl aminopeptidase) PepA [Bradyrhizobium sp. ORS 285]
MSDTVKVGFVPLSTAPRGIAVAFCDDALRLGVATEKALGGASDLIKRAAGAARFKGKDGSVLDLLAPEGIKIQRLIVIGTGKGGDHKEKDFLKYGGSLAGKLNAGTEAVTVLAELPSGPMTPDQVSSLAAGVRLRAYRFDRYKTKKKDEEGDVSANVSIAVADVAAAKKAFAPRAHVTDGVILARDLVNEPPNVLYPEEFAKRAAALRKLGVTVEILDVPAMKKLGMGALLGVGQGSARPSRTVVMRYDGGKKSEQPVAFIGKGVCFDTGGISIKPAGSMEDMKGDMGGAACVVGLMHALAARKAKANVIGAIGLVENMPDGNAQRPGDIVTSMSGQTIEIINTDAEGRLVLADVLWHVATKYKPKFMIDLATLTGAILVALGTEHAGLFSNNDDLADKLLKAGQETGEKVWRMPLGSEYDKLIDSQFADMKNTGGRHGGSITAAQFLQRFVNDTPWAHLDIAGTAMGAPKSEINQSWGSGYGVRLLDRLVWDSYEAKS